MDNRIAIPIALLLAALLLAGTMDHTDAGADRGHYCEMVGGGHWPDYRRIYEDEC